MPAFLRSQPSCHASLKFAGYSNLLNRDILKITSVFTHVCDKFSQLAESMSKRFSNLWLLGKQMWGWSTRSCGTKT